MPVEALMIKRMLAVAVYVADVNNGRVQKYRPRPGANPAFLVGKPWKGVW